MSDEENELATQEYIKSIQAQILEIVNSVKEELGSDIPIEVELKAPKEGTNE